MKRPILAYGDQHIFPFSSFSSPTDDGSTNVIEEHNRTFVWLVQKIRKHRPVLVVNLGDAAHNYGVLDSLSLRCAYDGYHLVADACHEVGADYRQLLGNHDFENEAKRIHCFPFVQPQQLVETMRVEHDMLFVPYYRDPSYVVENVRHARQNKKVNTAFIHLDFIGGLQNAYMVPSRKGVDPELFQGIRTFAGHYHHPQIHGDIHVVGSTQYRNFTDCVIDTPRGFVLIHEKEVERIENPHTSMYFSAKIDAMEDIKDIPKYIDPRRTYFRITYPDSVSKEEIEAATTHFLEVRTNPVTNAADDTQVNTLPANHTPYLVTKQFIADHPPEEGELPVAYVQEHAHDLIYQLFEEEQVSAKGVFVRIAGMKIRNFLPIGGAELVFDSVGVTYVDGRIDGMEEGDSNGAGKSAVMEALYWCFWGELLRKGKKDDPLTADDVVNSEAGSNCRVDTTFYINDDEYIQTRRRQDEEKGDKYCCIYKNGEPLFEGWELCEEKIVEILGCDKEIFKHTTFLMDTMETRFSQLGQKDRVTLLESILMTGIYGQLAETCHDFVKADKEILERECIRDRSLMATLNQHKETLALLEQEEAKWKLDQEESIAEFQESLDALDLEMEETKKDLGIKNRFLDKLNLDINKQSTIVDKAYEASSKLTSAVSVLLLKQEGMQDQLESWKQKRANAKKTGVCPYCGAKPVHALDWSEIDRLEKALPKLTDTLSKTSDLSAIKEHELQVALQEQRDLEKKNRDVKDLAFKAKHKLELLPGRIEEVQQHMTNIRQPYKSGAKNKVFNDISGTNEKLEEILHRSFELETKIELYSYLEWIFGPSGCRLWVLGQAVATLAALSADYVDFLSRGQVKASLSVDEKGISLEAGRVLSSGEMVKPKYGLASGGERRKVDCGLQFGTSRLSSLYSGFRCNLLFLDEIDEKLDSASRQRLVELLEKMAVENKQCIFIASHHRDIKTMTSRTLTIFNSDGVSELVRGEI